MPAPFDPYERWFDIPSNQRPPNHYQLLGVKDFESNLGVLKKAGEKRVQFLQDVSSGEHVVAAQNCLNQVAQAVVILTNPRKKLAYDRDLKKQIAAASAPLPPPLPAPISAPPPEPVASEQPVSPAEGQAFSIVDKDSKTSSRKKGSKTSALKKKGLKSSSSRSAADYSAARAKAKKRQLLILKLAAAFILLAIIGILVFILLTRNN